ncbi:MAG: GNAT family N-acetyltransferase [Acholeplasmataceae bacterium]|jgi:mycothiol synthase|nr:GNAT family N-acetyltransferase [Acholeplasmataceae bacterium]
METLLLNNEYLSQFKNYMSTYRLAHDETFLSLEDIENFRIDQNNHTMISIKRGEIIGCLSLMLSPYYLKANKARVRIFHCIEPIQYHYETLLKSIGDLSNEIEKLELFIPDYLGPVIQIYKSLGFTYYRNAYVMEEKNKSQVYAKFPKGFELKPFRFNQDEEAYAEVRNRAFRHLKGSEVPLTPDQVKDQYQDKSVLKDGMRILWHHQVHVGVIRMLLDEEGRLISFVAPIAIIPEYQGRGLGLELLNAGIEIGQNAGLYDCLLSLNSENEQALKLYKKLDFEVLITVSCYHLKI